MINLIIFILALIICLFLNKISISNIGSVKFQIYNSITSLLYLPIWMKLSNIKLESFSFSKYDLIAIISSIISTGTYIFYLKALEQKSATTVASLISIYPIIAYLFFCFFKLEEFNKQKILAMLFILIGVLIFAKQ